MFVKFILLCLIDWRILIFLICTPSVIVFHLTNSGVNVICHKWGYRNFDTHDNSKNNIWVNYLTAGA